MLVGELHRFHQAEVRTARRLGGQLEEAGRVKDGVGIQTEIRAGRRIGEGLCHELAVTRGKAQVHSGVRVAGGAGLRAQGVVGRVVEKAQARPRRSRPARRRLERLHQQRKFAGRVAKEDHADADRLDQSRGC